MHFSSDEEINMEEFWDTLFLAEDKDLEPDEQLVKEIKEKENEENED